MNVREVANRPFQADLFGHIEPPVEPTEYIVYHDESKEPGFWHIFFFVPEASRAELIAALEEAWRNSRFRGQHRHYSDLRSSPTGHNMADCWLQILHASFQKKIGSGMLHFTTGRYCAGGNAPRAFSRPLGCRMAVFRVENGHRDLSPAMDETRRIELTFRMGLQGACHYFHDEKNPMVLRHIFIDREKHYRRPLDKSWILEKLAERFRDYCQLHGACGIDGETVSAEDRIIIDAADILLGVVRNCCIIPDLSDLHRRKADHCRKVQPLLDDIWKGQKRMINSRLGIFGSLSNARIEDEQWIFASLHRTINDTRMSAHPGLSM